MRRLPSLHQCLDQDALRPAFNYALVNKEHVVATNAHIIVLHNSHELFEEDFLESIPEDGILLRKEALIDLTKSDIHSLKYHSEMKLIEILHVPKKGYIGSFRRYFEVKLASDLNPKFPEYMHLFEKMGERTPVPEVGFNTDLLKDLTKALGPCKGVKLTFYGAEHNILCTPISGDIPFAKGILMPMILSNND